MQDMGEVNIYLCQHKSCGRINDLLTIKSFPMFAMTINEKSKCLQILERVHIVNFWNLLPLTPFQYETLSDS